MHKYLELRDAKCKDCYKCLRACPVKAIEYVNGKARIIEDRCILCGKCTIVCPQNAKSVHSETNDVLRLIASGKRVVASVAPSVISSFNVKSFAPIRNALKALGFTMVEETAVGADFVTDKYEQLLREGNYKNFITSACPAVNRMIELHFPKALPYLARVDSPMVAHAKILKERYADCAVVFVGPCIAKKREGYESGVIDGVLTFEELSALLSANNIEIIKEEMDVDGVKIKSRCYPISRGIIKSFKEDFVDPYEYLAVDGVDKCMEVLDNIESYNHLFFELNACEFACINGPCSLISKGEVFKANGDVRRFASKSRDAKLNGKINVDIEKIYTKKECLAREVSEAEIQAILAKTGKTNKEHILDCGACGYNTCREKAWAVAQGYAEIDMCMPFMRERAEGLSYEIIKNSPNGIIVVDFDLKAQEMNSSAMALWGVKNFVKGEDLVTYGDPTPIIKALTNNTNIYGKKVKVSKTGKHVEMSVNIMRDAKTVFCILHDITSQMEAEERLDKVKLETLATTDEVIKKQMRVAQEIASLLGETTAESKVALLKLKKTLQSENKEV